MHVVTPNTWAVNSDSVNHRAYPLPNFANDSKNTGKHQIQVKYSFFLEELQAVKHRFQECPFVLH